MRYGAWDDDDDGGGGGDDGNDNNYNKGVSKIESFAVLIGQSRLRHTYGRHQWDENHRYKCTGAGTGRQFSVDAGHRPRAIFAATLKPMNWCYQNPV